MSERYRYEEVTIDLNKINVECKDVSHQDLSNQYLFWDGDKPFYHLNVFFYKVRQGQLRILPSGVLAHQIGAKESARQYANKIINFLKFCDALDVELEQVDYDFVVQTYQNAMLDGTWSEKGEPLSKKTTHPRVSFALNFLEYLSSKNEIDFAPDTYQTTETRGGITSAAGSSVTRTKYASVKSDSKAKKIRLPSRDALVAWTDSLFDLKASKGRAFCLMTQLGLHCGLRREEARSFQTEWLDKAYFDKTHGAYITEIRDFTKYSKPRDIQIPVPLYEALVDFKNRIRPKSDLPCLFVVTAPQGPRQIEDKEVTKLWQKNIDPEWTEKLDFTFHGLRHAFACFLFIDLLNSATTGKLERKPSDMKTIVQELLGHGVASSTDIYLQWARKQYFGLKISLERDR